MNERLPGAALLREHAQLAVRNIDLESDMDTVDPEFINGLES